MSSRVRATLLRLAALALAALSLPASNCSEDVGDGESYGLVTVRVSVKPFGEEVTAPVTPGLDGSFNASISGDGRFVAFESTSDKLTPSDSNGLRDIFVKDRATGAIENITLVIPGEFGPYPGDSFNPSISGDGRYVAFESLAYFNNATLGWTSDRQIWVYDRMNRTFRGASFLQDFVFVTPNQDCFNPQISADGRYVTWWTTATNVEADYDPIGDVITPYTTANGQVYVTDLQALRQDSPIKLLSHPPGAPLTGGNGNSRSPRISGDGAFVAFESQATDIDPPGPIGDGDTDRDVYVANTSTGAVELASIAFNPGSMADEKGDGESMTPVLSGDGRYVLFVSTSFNWGFPYYSLVRRDRQTSQTILVSDQLDTIYPVILAPDRFDLSADGNTVAFIVTERPAILDIATGSISDAGVSTTGTRARTQCFYPALSADGRWVSWHTDAENLVSDDTNGAFDIFVRGPFR